MSRSAAPCLPFLILLLLLLAPIAEGSFLSNVKLRQANCQFLERNGQKTQALSLAAAKDDKIINPTNQEEQPEKRGYQFGDLTRSIGRKVTGDPNYQFGDISRKLDQQAKARVEAVTGKEYVVGDLSKWADAQIKEKITNYTGKETYQVGDLSKEVVRRVWDGEYELEDAILIFRILLQMGAQFTPIARLMPIQFLLEVLGVGLSQDVGGRIMKSVALSLDERFKAAMVGDAKYKLGDKSRERIAQALAKVTGKDEYKFGDLSQMVAQRLVDMDKIVDASGNNNNKASEMSKTFLLELSKDGALKEWDRKVMEKETKKGRA